ncbi:Mur ligase [Parathielavia appendiculata]|uniref:tetrahydrofolate synthase n=1 Tax=Parathielavia appendiculata TaxID=2587402 RepID=A0AAN6Z9D7_9PEZI|nr:Mur ligase [Parathielavia appendiculata]
MASSDAYTTALTRLSHLQSNRAITSLFETTTPAATTGGSGRGGGAGGGALNALAIPEMLAWLARAGYTPSSLAGSGLRCVHVAGTKGKGSVSAFVASILSQYLTAAGKEEEVAGSKVALYTSPHVLSVRERIVLDGKIISREKFGRYAVTAAVITQLGVDHVSMLGNTVEKIAWHKAGVFKEGVKAFTRSLPEQKGVMEVLRARAREKGAELVEVVDDEVERWGGVDGAKLQGPFQKYNMALAVYAAREHLLRTGFELEGRFGTEDWSLSDIPSPFVQGLKEAALRGRCEVLIGADGIEWHVDGAHTDDSLAGVGRWFAGRTADAAKDGVRVLVFNQQERDPDPLLRALLAGLQDGRQPVFSHAIFTRNEEHKSAEGEARDITVQTKAQQTMRKVEPATKTVVYDAVQPAVEHVRHIATQARKNGKTCKVLVTGSFHLVGAVLKTIEQVENLSPI